MFIHLPKTGGTSIRKTMIHNDIFRVNTKGQCYKNKTTIADCNDPKVDTNIWSHSSLRDGVNYLKNKGYQPDEYFKFIFIRNPWDRMVSSYEYNIQIRAKRNPKWTFKSFEDFLHKKDIYPHIDGNFINTNYKFDFIGKFENIKEDMQTICKKIMKNNYRYINLPHKNATLRGHYRDYYNKETKKMVEEKCSKIIELGNYTF
tara:strand:+ start:427 stop:1032 length:606 start_codon:yes stop_codon:yes gene_type:complete